MDLNRFIVGKSVCMEEMLEAREERAFHQKNIQREFPYPLISFTLNIAGPIKVFPLSIQTFFEGIDLIRTQCQVFGIPIVHYDKIEKSTGYEAFFSVNGSAYEVKKILIELENAHSLGRLFDIDVLDTSGKKISRIELGCKERSCLLCQNPAYSCRRSGNHSLHDILERTVDIMWDYFTEKYAKDISFIAVRALLYEVMATPKPGLVDQNNNGSHKDMDIFTFETSALAILPYFKEFVNAGIYHSCKKPEDLLEQIRPIGIRAEFAMRKSTGGVNTHKGVIFSLGIILTCLGYFYGNHFTYDRNNIRYTCKRICSSISDELKFISQRPATSSGEKIFIKYGISGIRGEAKNGFPTLFQVALPNFYNYLDKGYSLNDSGVLTLIQIIACLEDTNIIKRSSYEDLQKIRQQMSDFLQQHPEQDDYIKELNHFDREFICQNISPGGSADILALTYFFYFFETGKIPATVR